MPSLLDMPDIPMKLILKYCDFPAILRLQKTCHDLRSYMRTVKPAERMSLFSISETKSQYLPFNEEIFLYIEFASGPLYNLGTSLKIRYINHRHGCELLWEQMDKKAWEEDREIDIKYFGGRILENENFMEIFMNDFKTLMDTQKGPVGKMKFWNFKKMNTVFDRHVSMSNVNSKPKPIQAKRAMFYGMHQDQILEILTHFQPSTLETISIHGWDDEKKVYMTISDVVESEQWKKSMRIYLTQGPYVVPIEAFAHLERGNLSLKTISVNDLRVLKEAFLTSPLRSKYFYLAFTDWPTDPGSIFKYLAPTFDGIDMEDGTHRWIYRRPGNSKQVLRIRFGTGNWNWKSFTYQFINVEDMLIQHRKMLPPVEDDVEEEVQEVKEVPTQTEKEGSKKLEIKEENPEKLSDLDELMVPGCCTYNFLSKLFS